MSEKIYAFLLRLYPAHFREAYGDAALQLFRDRSGHERGFFQRLRLWLDLLGDLAISIPRQHRRVSKVSGDASLWRHSEGGPLFLVLEGKSPRPGALLLGGLLSLATVAASGPIGRIIKHNRDAAASRLASGGKTAAVERASIFMLLPWQSSQQPIPHDAARATVPSAGGDEKIDTVARRRVIQASIEILKGHYIDREMADQMATALLAHEKGGDYDSATDGATLAELLTKQMRNVSHDNNLVVVYSKIARSDRPPGPTPDSLARYRQAMAQSNCTFERVEILAHNTGYLKLNSFPDLSVCRHAATAAMASLNQADAIIFDLRDNTGGFPNMVALIAAYLFDHPEYLYNPRENTTELSWTRSPVPGNRLADKPAYVLTSAKTLSGAEQFSYDLKMLKRAILVGETTGGAAHAGTYHRIDSHFGIGITETRAINPFSKADWDGTGVEPDVKVKAADALETAEKLAEKKFRKK